METAAPGITSVLILSLETPAEGLADELQLLLLPARWRCLAFPASTTQIGVLGAVLSACWVGRGVVGTRETPRLTCLVCRWMGNLLLLLLSKQPPGKALVHITWAAASQLSGSSKLLV